MNLVAFLLRASRGAVFLSALTGIASGVSTAVLLALIQAALHGQYAAEAVWPAWAFSGCCLVMFLTAVVSRALVVRVTQDAVCRLSVAVGRRILAVPLRRLEAMGTHRLFAVLTKDIPAIANAFLGIPTLTVNLVTLLSLLLYLAWLSLTMFGLVLGFMIVGVFTHLLLAARAQRLFRQGRADHDVLSKHMRGLLEGVKELKMHRRRRAIFIRECFQVAATAVRDRSRAALTVYVVIEGWGQLLLFGLIGLLLFALPVFLQTEAETSSGFVLAILFGIWPLSGILMWQPTLAEGQVALQQVEALDKELSEGEWEEEESSSAFPEEWHRLELVEVVHTYRRDGDEGGFVLGPLTVTLSRGTLLFLVGGNGSGKTTLAKLLTGLYAPEAGAIRLDGRAVSDDNREDYRQLFSAVFSDCFVFDNLLGLGDTDLDDRARTYLSRLHLDHKVRIERGRLSTVDLSEGQRKRLALLTAYLEDRPVYLFDEWAATQDPAFKEVFYTQLLPELKARGKTVVVITHDDRYFGVADRVLKLEDGKLIVHPDFRPTNT